MKIKNIIITLLIMWLVFSNTICVLAANYQETGDWDELLSKALSGKEITQEEANHLKNDKITSTFYDGATIDSIKEMLQNGSIKVSGSSSSSSSGSSSSSNSSTSTVSGSEYWHPKNIQSKLDQWKDMRSYSASDVEAIENYFTAASLSNLQALTTSDIDAIIQILDNINNTKNTSARPSTEVAKRLKTFSVRVQTVNVNGKHVATDSQIAALKTQTSDLNSLTNVSEKEETIENIISNPNTGAVDTEEIQNVQDQYHEVESNGTQSDKENHGIGHTAGEMINEADAFLEAGGNGDSIIKEEELKTLSDTIYNILLVVAIIVAVILGALLGIKFLMEGASGKAEVQKALLPYIIGCVVVFGSFTIWKIVVEVLQGLQ